ncbi:Isopropylmalate/homocitrate/citramalate synthases [Desulfonauticus submarinus]|uniref:Isopropylmalate/homocitrate/citramalate synthases n=1 Tax=Desulfonauticus submarinus TaxID=206665 RepID=A0A1H0EU22_9BACT|nr:cache domain-containing protein [Desulfonauticus submarinus]SDN85872.1 Isopropylmalate/homocitrate/citramalate synthases [Desulfonauticus submarinus]
MKSKLIRSNPVWRDYKLQNLEKPELYREIFPYRKVGRIYFDDSFVVPRPPEDFFITDTTFRDGQQARPPYTPEQILKIYDLLHKLGGFSGLIRQCEFFIYSDKDKRAVWLCKERGYRFPEITSWIRANENDLKLVKEMKIRETGVLTSVSDYHIYLKLKKDRKKALEDYLKIVQKALELNITPRCHFEDITRADIYGFCIPFAQKLMQLSEESGIPIKIRLCDTLGMGVPYPGAALPRSVPKLIRAFTDEAGVPSKYLEWHGHNDFHKAFVNGITAWLYGCSAVNGTLFGFGERTGNTPIEALAVEYISLTGDDDAALLSTITELARYFQKELGLEIPPNYPFAGRDFNATSAGIHIDGLMKNEEIYNIFDTNLLLDRPVPIIITDKAGKAGVAYWINHNLDLPADKQVDKRHPAVKKIYAKIMQAYEQGRTTNFSHQEMERLVKRFMPELFPSQFDHLKVLAHNIAAKIMTRLSTKAEFSSLDKEKIDPILSEFLDAYPFIQYIYLTDVKGKLITFKVSDPKYIKSYEQMPIGTDFSSRDWFISPMQSGKLHITDFYRSMFTGKLCLTVSLPIFDEQDEIKAILGADIRFEELLKMQEEIDEEKLS